MPTDFALSLRELVSAALEALEATLTGGPGFDPARLRRDFVIGASDYFHEMLMPPLAARLAGRAPGVRLKMLPARPGDLGAMLGDEGFDMALSIAAEAPAWVERAPAFRASNAVAARRDHSLLQGLVPGAAMPLDLFCATPHVIFSATRDFAHFEDRELARLGRSRDVRLTLSSYHGVARVVAQSDLIGVPARFALSLAVPLGLSVCPLPFEGGLVEMFLYWPTHDSRAPEQRWLSEQVLEVLGDLDEANRPVTRDELLSPRMTSGSP